ncbi:MAG: hypothetical protein RBR86_05135 [Pseudobdellovibrionaceae bacterium]|jgi:hypothetical protein|nr:hypothetical protein [Pseudobdellovibrionaceae bacterium]
MICHLRALALGLILVFGLSFQALAKEELFPRGYLPDFSELPDPTPEQIDEALTMSLNCKKSPDVYTFYDCDCVGMKFLEQRQLKGDAPPQTLLLIEAQKYCPNSAGVAGTSQAQCEGWAKNARPYDYEPFCECYANEFANMFASNTTGNVYVLEKQMTNAYKKCDGGKYLNERIAKKSMIQKFKDSQVYQLLFPGAVDTFEKRQLTP